MLKLDLTGHSSHVSFSRNILSSSSRALRGSEEKKGAKKKKTRVKKLKEDVDICPLLTSCHFVYLSSSCVLRVLIKCAAKVTGAQ